jgi:[ribosomal protein S18]-alanine N-acetyltransferase
MAIRVRDAESGDLSFLAEMLCEAAFPPEAERQPASDVFADPRLARWVKNWGRAGDLGVIATESDRLLGAAWCRLFDDSETRERGVIDNQTPELIIAVEPSSRGVGIGGRLLTALLARVRGAGFAGISLGVGETNPAIALYERHGFVKVDDGRKRWTMYCDLSN